MSPKALDEDNEEDNGFERGRTIIAAKVLTQEEAGVHLRTPISSALRLHLSDRRFRGHRRFRRLGLSRSFRRRLALGLFG